MTTSTGDTSAWKRLGVMLKQRRATLDPRFRNRKAFAEATGIDYRLIYDIEEARRENFGVTTLTAIAIAYQFPPDAIANFLAGGVLEPRTPEIALPSGERPLPILDDDDEPGLAPYLQDVRDDLAKATAKYGAVFSGVQAFDAPHEVELWDQDPRILTLKQKERLIARIRRLTAETLESEVRRIGLRRS